MEKSTRYLFEKKIGKEKDEVVMLVERMEV